jgi:hypothetical protein
MYNVEFCYEVQRVLAVCFDTAACTGCFATMLLAVESSDGLMFGGLAAGQLDCQCEWRA